MPYIGEDFREGATEFPENAGELSYALSQVIVKYLLLSKPKPRFADYNEVIGVLETLKLEIYRRLLIPYEEKMRAKNGDVFNEC